MTHIIILKKDKITRYYSNYHDDKYIECNIHGKWFYNHVGHFNYVHNDHFNEDGSCKFKNIKK